MTPVHSVPVVVAIDRRETPSGLTKYAAGPFGARMIPPETLERGSPYCVLRGSEQAEAIDEFRRQERTGRTLGSDGFVMGLERMLGRILRSRTPGPKPKPDPR